MRVFVGRLVVVVDDVVKASRDGRTFSQIGIEEAQMLAHAFHTQSKLYMTTTRANGCIYAERTGHSALYIERIDCCAQPVAKINELAR